MAIREHVEVERQPFGAPAVGSLALHIGIAGAFLLLAYINGHLHRDMWGSNEKQGAIQATLVSNAPALPLPQEMPPSPNVLATETPSPAPMIEAQQPKAAPIPDETAIPIPVKEKPKPKEPPKKQPPAEKPTPKPPTPLARPALHPQPAPQQQNRAQYGQGAPQMARSTATNQGPQSPVEIKGGATGFQYGWYVEVITRKVRQNWYPSQAPIGTEVSVNFTVNRSGQPSNVRVEKSSGNPSYDSSAVRAVQRVDTFGPLPAGYNQSTLIVTYTFSTSNDGSGR